MGEIVRIHYGEGIMKKVVAAIIMENGKVLIGKRKSGFPMAHKWEFPGGKIERGETPEACLKRELFEELEIVAEIGPFFGSGMSGQDSPYPIELLVYRASYRAGGPLALHEHEELRWVLPSDLGDYDFPEADRPIVMRLMTGVEGEE
jgi:8-oxo-dGTP diphosphatase